MFNVFQALKGLEQRSSSLIDMVSNSTGRTVDVMYATLVHRCAHHLPSKGCHQTFMLCLLGAEDHAGKLMNISKALQRPKASLAASRLGLSAPFFKSGWGDLGVVTFEEAESLLKGWPPEHFDTEVSSRALHYHTAAPASEVQL